jgi:tRNA (uracil-5-)-methyltransferase
MRRIWRSEDWVHWMDFQVATKKSAKTFDFFLTFEDAQNFSTVEQLQLKIPTCMFQFSLRPVLILRNSLIASRAAPALGRRLASGLETVVSTMDGKQDSKKRPKKQHGRMAKKHKRMGKSSLETVWRDGSTGEVLLEDIRAFLQETRLDDNDEKEGEKHLDLPSIRAPITLQVKEISSTGDALAVSSDYPEHVFVVPFAVPGDTVIAKPFQHVERDGYSLADLVEVTRSGPQRDDSLVRCGYFAKCSGCQFQMLPYNDQLAHKKSIVLKAYRNFSRLDPTSVPEIGDTMGSPLQYGYRTKLTPHFDGPWQGRADRRKGIKPEWPGVPPIGFMMKGTRKTVDIEDCPIGTDAVRLGMKRERDRVAKTINDYRRGATLLLRESTERVPKNVNMTSELGTEQNQPVIEDVGNFSHLKICETDSNATSKEYIDDFVFTNPAGSFFQNNNSILSPFTQYIREQIIPKAQDDVKISYLVDAYCGSGLFTITLSSLFKRSIGIDISAQSIEYASKNAALNKLSAEHATFMAADAANIFEKMEFPAGETVVVIDPPRKGCDQNFLSQLLRFGPQRIVYVSCNVHTQARDVGVLVDGLEDVTKGLDPMKGAYEIESLKGFDFFPQTGHVESVAVLRRRAASIVVEPAAEKPDQENPSS